MNNRFARVAALAGVALAISHGAFATTMTIAGSATFNDLTYGNHLVVVDTNGHPSSTNAFSIGPVTIGTVYTITGFLDICAYLSGNQTSTTTETDIISETFTISAPATGSGTLNGTATETETIMRGHYDSFTGSVSWSNPLTIMLGNKQTLTISLDNIQLTPSGECSGYDVCGKDSVHFTLNDPKPVPEPATLALIGGGLLGLGYVRRRGTA